METEGTDSPGGRHPSQCLKEHNKPSVRWKSFVFHTLPVRRSHCTLGNPKKSFSTILFICTSDYLRYLTRKQSVMHLPTPPENVTTRTSELQNFFIWLKVCCVLSDILGSEKSQLWVVVGGSVMCGNWNVRQAMSHQVFRVTTFCINTCFQSFSTLISHIVHHDVLKFSPCRNKLLQQASTRPYQYTHSSCSVPQTQY